MQTNTRADSADSPIQSQTLKDNQFRNPIYAVDLLMKPEECVMLLVDFQAGLGFGVESTSRQVVLNNALGLGADRCRFQSSGRRIDFGITSPQRSATSPAAGGTSFYKGNRTKKHERSGG